MTVRFWVQAWVVSCAERPCLHGRHEGQELGCLNAFFLFSSIQRSPDSPFQDRGDNNVPWLATQITPQRDVGYVFSARLLISRCPKITAAGVFDSLIVLLKHSSQISPSHHQLMTFLIEVNRNTNRKIRMRPLPFYIWKQHTGGSRLDHPYSSFSEHAL